MLSNECHWVVEQAILCQTITPRVGVEKSTWTGIVACLDQSTRVEHL